MRLTNNQSLEQLLPFWQKQGWITPENAQAMQAYYRTDPAQSSSRSFSAILVLFACLLIGGGVITLFAANWANLGKTARLILSFTPLVISQITLFFVMKQRIDHALWREAAALCVAISVGAAMGLIGQTYQIHSSLLNFVLTWLLLSLPLAYVARSGAVMLFVTGLIVWGHSLGLNWFSMQEHGPIFTNGRALLLLVPWLVWQYRGGGYMAQNGLWRTLVVTITLVYALWAVIVLTDQYRDGLTLWILLWSLASAVYLGSHAFIPGRSVLSTLSALGLAGLLLSAIEFWRYGIYGYETEATLAAADEYSVIIFLGLAVAAWFARRGLGWQRWALVAAGFVVAGMMALVLYFPGSAWAWMWVITVLIFVLGIGFVHRDIEHSLVGLNLALLWILFALGMRFFDDSTALWFKGMVFIGFGAGIIAVNSIAIRGRRKGEAA